MEGASKRFLISILIVTFISTVLTDKNKYSRSANDFRKLEKPFRMSKLNMLWLKAQQRLTEPKLKSLYSDLMIHDKEEITFKRVKNEGGDKEGYREAELRRKLTSIMSNYGLREHFEDNPNGKHKDMDRYQIDAHINKSLFKDKKLNQLWAKAEASGFTNEELSALKEEFNHHQDKIDQYYDLLDTSEIGKDDGYKNAVNDEELEDFNEIKVQLDTNEINKHKVHMDKANLVRDKHRNLRDGFDRLHRLTAKGPNNKEFIEPKVQGLWRMATESNFTVDELDSLKGELQHYESRLLKLRTLHADHVNNVEKHGKIAASGNKMDHFDEQQQMIKKHTRKVEKIHAHLESRILERHNEL